MKNNKGGNRVYPWTFDNQSHDDDKTQGESLDMYLENFESDWNSFLDNASLDLVGKSADKQSRYDKGKPFRDYGDAPKTFTNSNNNDNNKDDHQSKPSPTDQGNSSDNGADSDDEVGSAALEERRAVMKEVRDNFMALSSKYNDLKNKYIQVTNLQKQTQLQNKTLQVQIELLEDDKVDLEKTLREQSLATQKASTNILQSQIKKQSNKKKRIFKNDQSANGNKNMIPDISLVLMDNADDDDDLGETHQSLTTKQDFKHLLVNLTALILKHTPFEKDVKEINAYYGSGVASYFEFIRWV
jgi:septum formation topological specificity factor MinE